MFLPIHFQVEAPYWDKWDNEIKNEHYKTILLEQRNILKKKKLHLKTFIIEKCV